MTGTDPIPSPRHTWITIGYVVVAIGFCFVPGIGIEWFPAPRSQVLAGGIATAIALGAVHLFRNRWPTVVVRSEEHTSELQSRFDLVCRLLLEKKKEEHVE